MGFSFCRQEAGSHAKREFLSNDSETELKLFPHLFPFGKGNYVKDINCVSLAQYFRIKLANRDARWREDKYFLFYAYDRLVRERIFSVNGLIKARNSLYPKTDAASLSNNNFDDYFKYGNCVPKCITGFKDY